VSKRLKCPWPWFGGKSAVADLVWERLGNCDNYIEPFAGSLAVLLARPHQPRVETCNDADSYIANFWRATSRDPEGVVEYCDQPVFEVDLHAMHRWLVLGDDAETFRQRIRTDPDFFDVKVAGRWTAGLCMWIGAGFAVEPGQDCHGPNGGSGERAPRLSGDGHGAIALGVHRTQMDAPSTEGFERPQIPDGGTDTGVHGQAEVTLWQQRPLLSGGGEAGSTSGGRIGIGVHARGDMHLPQGRPQLADAHDLGRGVHASAPEGRLVEARPRLECEYAIGQGIHANNAAGTCDARRAWLLDWFSRLRDRLRLVRVCCGDWTRVCTSESVTTRLGVTGLFLDPPYAHNLKRLHAWINHLQGDGPPPEPPRKGKKGNRSAAIYASEAADMDRLVADVHTYCARRGQHPLMRIALCGYAGEHEPLEKLGWSVVSWESGGGYANRGKDEGDHRHRRKERIWFSPHCQSGNPLLDWRQPGGDEVT
jgi:hypothetical protein